MRIFTAVLVLSLFFCISLGEEIIVNNTSSDDVFDYIDINAKLRKSQIFDLILNPPRYHSVVRPMGVNGSGPVTVEVSIRLRSVENLDDEKMEYSVQMNYRQEWIDPRLKFYHLQKNVKYLQLMLPQRAWLPDIFFANEKTGTQHDLMLPNIYARIYPDGKVETSARVSLLLACQMDLRFYPMDEQSCPIKMGSYGWTEDDVIVIWRKYSAVEINEGIRMPRFKLISYANQTCRNTITSSGSYSCIVLRLEFQRQFGYYLIQMYIPCIMLVVVSWVSFWLEPHAAEARISLCVTTILTVVTQAYGINQSVPPASYIKAIDVWTFTVQFMVFASVLQYSYVNYCLKFEWQKNLKNSHLSNEEMENKREKLKLQGERKAKRIDNISKMVFPVFFSLFNIGYWVTYWNPDTGDVSAHYAYE